MTTLVHCRAEDWPDDIALCQRIAPAPLAVRHALRQVEIWMTGRSLDHGDALIVLAEVLNNLVEHGRAADGHGIELCLRPADAMLLCEVHDPFVSFDPTCAIRDAPDLSNATTDMLPEGGFGLMLLNALAVDVSYTSHQGHNCLSLKIPVTPSTGT